MNKDTMVEIIELYQRRRKISQETFPARMSNEFTPHAKNAPLITGFNRQEAFVFSMAG